MRTVIMNLKNHPDNHWGLLLFLITAQLTKLFQFYTRKKKQTFSKIVLKKTKNVPKKKSLISVFRFFCRFTHPEKKYIKNILLI
jgi:hypothetical protein